MKHVVKAEFIDAETGARVGPAASGAEPVLFVPHDDEQLARLVAAGCLNADPAVDLSVKAIEDMSRPELEDAAMAVARASLANASDDDLRGAIAAYRASLPQLDHDKAGGAKAPSGEPATAEEINTAIALLDAKTAAHWTQAGLPSVEAVAELVGGGKVVTRGAISEAAPDAKRPAADA